MSVGHGVQPAARPDEVTELVVVPDVDRDSGVADVMRRALAAPVVRLLRHERGVRLGADPEDVHQARVATRRLRSNLRTFRDVLEADWASALRQELRWLGRDLGAVRDAEVLRDRLESRVGSLPEEDRSEVDTLIRELDARRDRARDRLVATIGAPRYRSLRDALVDAARAPRVIAQAASAAAAPALRPAIRTRWKALAGAIDVVVEDPSDEAMHAARIRAKHVRYAAESVAPVFGGRAAAFARAARDLQDVLGEHHDAVVAQGWLREAAEGEPGSAFAAGRLAALEAEAAREAEERWPKAWKTLSRKRLRFWS